RPESRSACAPGRAFARAPGPPPAVRGQSGSASWGSVPRAHVANAANASGAGIHAAQLGADAGNLGTHLLQISAAQAAGAVARANLVFLALQDGLLGSQIGVQAGLQLVAC